MGNISSVMAFTNYTLHLEACTAAGCTESRPGVQFVTPSELPTGVRPPRALTIGPTYIVLQWESAEQINGPLTGYQLFLADQQVYSGLATSFRVDNLLVFTVYQFQVSICNSVGCTVSAAQTYATSSSATTVIAAPVLVVFGSSRMRVEWRPADRLDGTFRRYVVYVDNSSSVTATADRVVYNSTDRDQTQFVLTGLLPDTRYRVKVGVCTSQGCGFSPIAEGLTPPRPQFNISAPIVTSPSPSELHITWRAPAMPLLNPSFRVHRNGLLIHQSAHPGSLHIRDLHPHSRHVIRLEVCAASGCGFSDDVTINTLEAAPRGVVELQVQLVHARSVRTLWRGPDSPNGILTYELRFQGPFYALPDSWNYSLITERRVLLVSNSSGTWEVVTNLLPMSTYFVDVTAANSQGFLVSDTQRISLPFGSPDGVKPPTLLNLDPRSIRVLWSAVGRANSPQPPLFQLYYRFTSNPTRTLLEQPSTSTMYVVSQLRPFTVYQFRLGASNLEGETLSSWVEIRTLPDRPGLVDPPMVTNVASTSVSLVWSPPLEQNGKLLSYRIFTNNGSGQSVAANVTSMEVQGLQPYTNYTFQLSACTDAGCTRSSSSRRVWTMVAAPDQVEPPQLTSESATSVTIRWTSPDRPNGVIVSYKIQRKSLDSQPQQPVDVVVVNQGDALFHVDDGPGLTPFTMYLYRVVVTSSGGTSSSDWARVSTQSARPAGIHAPRLTILSPTSLRIDWFDPERPNGQLAKFVIALPIPRVEVLDPTRRTATVHQLTPYRLYKVVLIACTDGGCTESEPTEIRMDAAAPADLDPPSCRAISQTYIAILWQPPSKPNGPNLRYELARMKVRQPLTLVSTDAGNWQSVYAGLALYHDDRSVSLFTTYRYRVTAYNNLAHVVSDSSPEVTTFGGVPTGDAVVTARALSHSTVKINWVPPGVQVLQGAVAFYHVSVQSIQHSTFNMTFYANESEGIIRNLTPNSDYEITFTMLTHGGYRRTSPILFVQTLDGRPEGLEAPTIHPINDTSLRLAWKAPRQSNAHILQYFVYVNGRKFPTNRTQPGSFVLTDLRPFVMYRIEVEACSRFGCVRSDEVKTATAESVPANLKNPNIVMDSSSQLTVSWLPPQQPNGIILSYQLRRIHYFPCHQSLSQPSGFCKYVVCNATENFCGEKCYSGRKTCCDGTIHESQVAHRCCGREYLRVMPGRTVCCGGRFYREKQDYQCCASRYLKVKPEHVCCQDPDNDRVSIGVGDSCCGGFPHKLGGAQICCQDELHSAFQRQCCGQQMVSAELQCCGNATHGAAYQRSDEKACCGADYANESLSVCCQNEHGHARVHSFESSEHKQSAVLKCCGTSLVSAALSCCNQAGFGPMFEVCADTSENPQMLCGTGSVCPSHQVASAFCDRCDFDRQAQRCAPQVQRRSKVTTDPAACQSDVETVYSGLALVIVDRNLSAFTRFRYAVSATNGAGEATSGFSEAWTAESVPGQPEPPLVIVPPDTLDAVQLRWSVPAEPNGVVLSYSVLRDGVEVFRHGTALQWRDQNAVQPYRSYSYRLRVCNSAGCATSDQKTVSTREDVPETVLPPALTAAAEGVQLRWDAPGKANGALTRFVVYLLPVLARQTPPDVMTLAWTGLAPFAEHTFILAACTAVGCSNSSQVSTKTLEAAPSGVGHPQLVVISSTELEIHWTEPSSINGRLQSYTLYSAVGLRPFQEIYSGGKLVMVFTHRGLVPQAQYRYKLSVSTSGGQTNSSESKVVMPQLTPTNIPAPLSAVAISSTEIQATWTAPANLPSPIDHFQLLLNAGQPTQVERSFGLARSGRVDRLKPFTTYDVRIRICLRGEVSGCGLGPAAFVRTLEAPPTGMKYPTLTALSSAAVRIEWKQPLEPNGKLTSYRIERRLGPRDNSLLITIVDFSTFLFDDIDNGLGPAGLFQYRITASNAQGETSSSWASVRTMEAAPFGLSRPFILSNDAYSIMLRWEHPVRANGVITKFLLRYRKEMDPARVQHVAIQPNIRQTTISGLSPFTRYQVQVVAVNGAGSASSDWSDHMTNQAAPAGVGPLRVEKVHTGLSVILSWDEPIFPNGHILSYLIHEAGISDPIYQGSTREFEMRRLSPATTYRVLLEACTIGGCSRSPLQLFTTAEVAPANLAAPVVTFSNATHVAIKWSSPGSPNGVVKQYQIWRRQVIGANEFGHSAIIFQMPAQSSGEELVYVDSNVLPASSYQYRIRAVNTAGHVDSPWQVVVLSQSAPTELLPPIVQLQSGEPSQLLVTWRPPLRMNGQLQHYLLQRNETVPWSFQADSKLQYLDTDLYPSTVYSYQVTACTQGGCTSSTRTVIRTLQQLPVIVLPPTAEAFSSNQISLRWTEPQLNEGKVGNYSVLLDNIVRYTGLARSTIIDGLIPYRLYSIILRACTVGGCKDSQPITARPLEAPPVGMRKPQFVVTSATSVELSWTEPLAPNGNITSYEVRRDGQLLSVLMGLTLRDSSIAAGQEYSYTVTVYNSKGSTTSPAVTVSTYLSSPSGLTAPQVTVISPSSLQVTWQAPLQSNGEIVNYTLLQDGAEAYTGLQRVAVILNLEPFRTYAFAVRACTLGGCAISSATQVMTQETKPGSIAAPQLVALADATGAHAGVYASWLAPESPNGDIIQYELYRRKGSNHVTIYSGLSLNATELPSALRPDTEYQYMVAVINSRGSVSSDWSTITTKESPPSMPQPPLIKAITARTAVIVLRPPLFPNGAIQRYNILLDGHEVLRTRSLEVTLGKNVPLASYRNYSVALEACTSVGCTRSNAVQFRTWMSRPTGLNPPQPVRTTQDQLQLKWSEPAQPNGLILRYELDARQTCPHPYANANDELKLECVKAAWKKYYSGPDMATTLEGLSPYTTYELRLNAFTAVGGSEEPPLALYTTHAAAPVYMRLPKIIIPSDKAVRLDWAESFAINGEFREFKLWQNGSDIYQGPKTSYLVFRKSSEQLYQFQVIIETVNGSTRTPRFIFDPSKDNFLGPIGDASEAGKTQPFYKSDWFIALWVILALLLLCLLLCCCFRFMLRRSEDRQSIIKQELIKSRASPKELDTINPAYSQISLINHTDSLAELDLDKLSQKHLSEWDTDIFNNLDSGMHSLTYREDFPVTDEQPVGIIREHQVFPDTHI